MGKWGRVRGGGRGRCQMRKLGRGRTEPGGRGREQGVGQEGRSGQRAGQERGPGGAAPLAPRRRAGPASAGRRAPCAGSTASGPWSCAARFRTVGTWWGTCPGCPPGRAGPSQRPAPRTPSPTPLSRLGTHLLHGLGVAGTRMTLQEAQHRPLHVQRPARLGAVGAQADHAPRLQDEAQRLVAQDSAARGWASGGPI